MTTNKQQARFSQDSKKEKQPEMTNPARLNDEYARQLQATTG